MNDIEQINNNYIGIHPLDWVGCMNHLIKEHYIDHLENTYIGINVSNEIIKFKQDHSDIKIILYNLEHKYPQPSPGVLNNCSPSWLKYFVEIMQYIDEVWDFNIENYEYFRDIGHGDKFRFVPLRYITWFEQFHPKHEPRYDFEFEATIDTTIRKEILRVLTTPIFEQRLSFKMCTISDKNIKYLEKLDGRFGFDFPHYDTPETINAFRIFEYLCLNIQPIIFDPYKITSKEYFGDLAIYLNYLSPQSIWEATRQEPRKDVAQKFKEMTYTPGAFEEYRKRIVDDFVTRTGTQVPDSVLAPVC